MALLCIYSRNLRHTRSISVCHTKCFFWKTRPHAIFNAGQGKGYHKSPPRWQNKCGWEGSGCSPLLVICCSFYLDANCMMKSLDRYSNSFTVFPDGLHVLCGKVELVETSHLYGLYFGWHCFIFFATPGNRILFFFPFRVLGKLTKTFEVLIAWIICCSRLSICIFGFCWDLCPIKYNLSGFVWCPITLDDEQVFELVLFDLNG